MLKRFFVVCGLVCLLSGCGVFRQAADDELHENGGIVGKVADEAIPAPNKEMQVFRASFAFAFLVRIGSITVSDPNAARAMYWYIAAVNTDINRLGSHLSAPRDCSNIASGGDCRPLFEADLPDLETHMFNLAVATIPGGQLKGVLTDLTSGSYLNAVIALAKMASSGVLAAHSAASVYRSEEEILAQIMAASGGPPYSSDNVHDAAIYLEKYYGDAAKFPSNITLKEGNIHALFNIAESACVKISTVANSDPDIPTAQRVTCALQYLPTGTP